jgi:hypothetical protein
MTNHYIQRRRKSGPTVDIDDPVFRSKVISYASTGGSRRTVAALVGKPEATLRGWINRGLAYPDVEPYGSFSEDYRRAERGMDGAIATVKAQRVQLLAEQMRKRLAWEDRGPPPLKPAKPRKPPKVEDEAAQLAADLLHELAMKEWEEQVEAWQAELLAWSTPPETPSVADMAWLENLRISRHPEDYGTSKHRQPDVEYSGSEYLDANAMDREQLGALFCDPPEAIRQALTDQAHAVYRILVEAGFDPASPIPRKADEDETERAEADSREDDELAADAGPHGPA